MRGYRWWWSAPCEDYKKVCKYLVYIMFLSYRRGVATNSSEREACAGLESYWKKHQKGCLKYWIRDYIRKLTKSHYLSSPEDTHSPRRDSNHELSHLSRYNSPAGLFRLRCCFWCVRCLGAGGCWRRGSWAWCPRRCFPGLSLEQQAPMLRWKIWSTA